MAIVEITYVPHDYEMNPETERLVADGTYLKNGMTVLLAHRVDRIANMPRRNPSLEDIWLALAKNRWGEISDVHISGGTITFTATYDTGVKRKREEDLNCPWLVKKE